ncbi:hypothetical protein LSH36_462g02072 [Paralvinella palmiformis]|uniref:Uncharacterized protein n=1 Tax=Paralvinella palmiformis TaxID=53620 RepID=A0AAD9JAL8_9ANNE|nr:hypothetical protein LSH36_462g02072 [Paralvinella palmiformis]
MEFGELFNVFDEGGDSEKKDKPGDGDDSAGRTRKSIDLLKKVKGKHSIDQVYDKDDGVETAKKMKASLDEELRQVIILNGNSL